MTETLWRNCAPDSVAESPMAMTWPLADEADLTVEGHRFVHAQLVQR